MATKSVHILRIWPKILGTLRTTEALWVIQHHRFVLWLIHALSVFLPDGCNLGDSGAGVRRRSFEEKECASNRTTALDTELGAALTERPGRRSPRFRSLGERFGTGGTSSEVEGKTITAGRKGYLSPASRRVLCILGLPLTLTLGPQAGTGRDGKWNSVTGGRGTPVTAECARPPSQTSHSLISFHSNPTVGGNSFLCTPSFPMKNFSTTMGYPVRNVNLRLRT